MIKTALITGASQRIGKQIAKTLHDDYNVIIHYRNSQKAAQNFADELNKIRHNSATIIQADFEIEQNIIQLINSIEKLDLLVNNASSFYPTLIDQITTEKYHKVMNTNVLAPLLLSQKLAKKLAKNNGNIVNIVDIHAERPLKDYAIYNISKAGILMLTKTLAKELAPNIRVNGVSPGSIFWPENSAELGEKNKQKILKKIPLAKQGNAKNIADTVLFLAKNDYINGQIINVDGGRSLNQ